MKNKLPAIFHSKDFVEVGGLMAYGAEFADLYRRGDLRRQDFEGRQAGRPSVEQPKKFERADKIIK